MPNRLEVEAAAQQWMWGCIAVSRWGGGGGSGMPLGAIGWRVFQNPTDGGFVFVVVNELRSGEVGED